MKFDFGSLDKPFEAEWPVTVQVPVSGGTTRDEILNVRFKLLAEEQLAQLGDGIEGSKNALRQVVLGFGSGETEAFTPELLERMMSRPYVRAALNKAYTEFAVGIAAKNSKPPPA